MFHFLYIKKMVKQEDTGEEDRSMDTQEQLNLLKQGKAAWNTWRAKQPPGFIADLRDIFLHDAVLDQCDLSRGDFSHATFWRCSFIGADLSFASLFQCNLMWANLRGANLSHASILQCHFTGADLNGARLPKTR